MEGKTAEVIEQKLKKLQNILKELEKSEHERLKAMNVYKVLEPIVSEKQYKHMLVGKDLMDLNKPSRQALSNSNSSTTHLKLQKSNTIVSLSVDQPLTERKCSKSFSNLTTTTNLSRKSHENPIKKSPSINNRRSRSSAAEDQQLLRDRIETFHKLAIKVFSQKPQRDETNFFLILEKKIKKTIREDHEHH